MCHCCKDAKGNMRVMIFGMPVTWTELSGNGWVHIQLRKISSFRHLSENEKVYTCRENKFLDTCQG